MRINREKLVTELIRRDYTMRKLAELSGVSAQTLSYIRSGKGCSERTGKAIADALGIEVDELREQN